MVFHPHVATYVETLGEIDRLLGNATPLMKELTAAAELDPGNPEIDMAFGLAYQARGDLGKSAEYFRRALRKKPDYAEAHNNLGVVLSHLGRGDEAVREFEAAASDVLYATPEVAYYNLGEEYRRRKDFPKAEQMYRRSISLNDRYADAYLRLYRSVLEERRTCVS